MHFFFFYYLYQDMWSKFLRLCACGRRDIENNITYNNFKNCVYDIMFCNILTFYLRVFLNADFFYRLNTRKKNPKIYERQLDIISRRVCTYLNNIEAINYGRSQPAQWKYILTYPNADDHFVTGEIKELIKYTWNLIEPPLSSLPS